MHVFDAAAVHDDRRLELRQPVADLSDLRPVCGVRDDDPGPGVTQPVLERVRPEEHEQRHRDDPRPVRGKVRDACLVTLREEDRDAVPGPQSEADVDVGELVRQPPQLPERPAPDGAVLALLDEGVAYFPRNVPLIYQAAWLNARQGFITEAGTLIARGLDAGADPAFRTRLEQLRSRLSLANNAGTARSAVPAQP